MKTRLAAAAVIVAALIAILVVIVTGSSSKPHPAAKAAVAQCRATPESNSYPTAPPPDLRWRNVGSMLVPTSASDGPTRYDGPVWSCYAHNPMGAVLAAYDIFAGLGSPDWRTVAEHDVIPGPGQQAFIAAGEQQTYSEPAPGNVPPAVGFAVVSYTPQQATIETLANGGEDYQSDQLTVAWTGGDWKMVLTPDGRTGPDTQLVTSADGFVLWGAGGNG